VTLAGDAEWPKVADAVIEAESPLLCLLLCRVCLAPHERSDSDPP
jgi:hypothetical protein